MPSGLSRERPKPLPKVPLCPVPLGRVRARGFGRDRNRLGHPDIAAGNWRLGREVVS